MAPVIAALGQIIMVVGKPEKAASTIKNWELFEVLKDVLMAYNNSIFNLLSPVF